MERKQLFAYLKSIGRSEAAIKRSIHALSVFEDWLEDERGLTIEDEISLEDLQAFIQSAKKGQKNLLMGLANVFDFQGNGALKDAAIQMRRDLLDQAVTPMLLREFIGVKRLLVDALAAKGIYDAHQLLRACRTPEERKALARELNVP